MAKVVIAKLGTAARGERSKPLGKTRRGSTSAAASKTPPGHGTVSVKRVVGPDNRITRILTIDADSPTFASDLQYVFQKNVERARRDNKKKVGAAGRVQKS